MELAKVTSRGQITLPLAIRRKLDVKEGDKVVFYEENLKASYAPSYCRSNAYYRRMRKETLL